MLALAAAFSAAAGALALFTDGIRDEIADAWILALTSVVLLALFRTVRLLAPTTPSLLDEALRRMRRRKTEAPQIALERDVALSSANAFHFHVRLRPVLRGIAAYRLRSRYGVDLDREPARAREFVPARAWAVVAPDRPPPEDRLAAGPRVHEIAAVVDDLESV
jgi:hypothetical protein